MDVHISLPILSINSHPYSTTPPPISYSLMETPPPHVYLTHLLYPLYSNDTSHQISPLLMYPISLLFHITLTLY